MLTENELKRIVRETINKLLMEGYIDDVYMSDNFKKWFNGSKMVDENGKPLLLGHATRSFGFNKFNTQFIHLAPIDDASYFSGGNKRMFRYKNTINKLTDEEVIDLYNRHIKYKMDENIYLLDDETSGKIIRKYDEKLNRDLQELMKYWSEEEIQENLKQLETCKKLFVNRYNKYKGQLCCKPYHKGIPHLRCYENQFKVWLSDSFPTIKQLRKDLLYTMFKTDNYVGKGGTYALCAKVLNPLHINCQWRSWDKIYISRQNCSAYSELFDKYCELGWNDSRLHKGSDFPLDNESIAFLAKECGYDGVIFHNIKEGAYGNIGMKETYIVYSTKQLKSPFENNGNFGDVEN